MVSVIIPTLNAGKQIGGLLHSLKSQTIPCEVTVIDSSSEDNTVAIAGSYGARTMVTDKNHFDHGGTRTAAGKSSNSWIVIYLTQDALPADNETIENLIRPFEDNTVGAVYGRQLANPDANPFAAHLRLFNYPDASYVRSLSDRKRCKIKTPFLSNSCTAYRRSALEETGWFREKLILGEDTYAGARLLLAGYKIAYAAGAMVYHSHNYSAREEFSRYFDIGVFHSSEAWILSEFGGAGGEGISYVKSAAGYLINKGRYLLLPELAVRTGLKFAGYNLGRIHKRLPLSLIKKMSMHKDWF